MLRVARKRASCLSYCTSSVTWSESMVCLSSRESGSSACDGSSMASSVKTESCKIGRSLCCCPVGSTFRVLVLLHIMAMHVRVHALQSQALLCGSTAFYNPLSSGHTTHFDIVRVIRARRDSWYITNLQEVWDKCRQKSPTQHTYTSCKLHFSIKVVGQQAMGARIKRMSDQTEVRSNGRWIERMSVSSHV